MNKWQKKLDKYFTAHFGWMVEDRVEWYTDKETNTAYEWQFRYDGTKYRLICDKTTGKVRATTVA